VSERCDEQRADSDNETPLAAEADIHVRVDAAGGHAETVRVVLEARADPGACDSAAPARRRDSLLRQRRRGKQAQCLPVQSRAAFADAIFPNCNYVPSGRYFLRGVASHQEQIRAKAWRDSATIIQMKRGGGDRRG
jgi:hypothetical protein